MPFNGAIGVWNTRIDIIIVNTFLTDPLTVTVNADVDLVNIKLEKFNEKAITPFKTTAINKLLFAYSSQCTKN